MQRAFLGFAAIAVLLFLGQAQALILSAESDYVVTGYEVALVFHVLLFVFWLGPDVGVYVWSTKAASAAMTPNQRLTAGRMMHTIEFMPRVCVSLMLTVGGILTEVVGLDHPTWQWIGIILLGPIWLFVVVVAYFREGTWFGDTMAKLDGVLRWIIIVSVIVSTTYSLITGRLEPAPWVAGKLYLFAAIVFLGLMMRQQMEPFFSNLKRLENEEPNDEINNAMSASLGRGRLFIFAIWAALLIAAWLGISQPGSSDSAQPISNAWVVGSTAQEG